MNTDRFLQSGIEIINEDRQAGDVVHVWVSDNDVPHSLALVGREGDGNAARIDSNALVNQEACESLIECGAAVAVKGAG